MAFYLCEQEDISLTTIAGSHLTCIHNSICRKLAARHIRSIRFSLPHTPSLRGTGVVTDPWCVSSGTLNPKESGYNPFIPAHSSWGSLLGPPTYLWKAQRRLAWKSQQLCPVATQAEIYDSSSRSCGVAEGENHVDNARCIDPSCDFEIVAETNMALAFYIVLRWMNLVSWLGNGCQSLTEWFWPSQMKV